jgi:hypothetical protein
MAIRINSTYSPYTRNPSSHTFTTLEGDEPRDIRAVKFYNHRLSWSGAGTRTTGNIKLEQSTTGAFAGEETDLIANQSATTDGTATATGFCNFVRINCTAISGAGNTIYATYEGTPTGGQSVTISGLVTDTDDGTAPTEAPVGIGGVYSAQPTARDDGDRVNVRTGAEGEIIVRPYASTAQAVSGCTAAITDTTSTVVIAGVASNYIYVTQVYVQNASATVPTWVLFQDGSAGSTITTLPSIYCGINGGGGRVTLDPPVKVPTAGNGLFIVAVTTGASFKAWADGFKRTF